MLGLVRHGGHLRRRVVVLPLVVPLEAADGGDDLPLGALGDLVPERRHAALAERRPVRTVERHLEGPRDALRVHEVADEAGHRDAAVLELGLAQEADGRRVRLVEELLERELEGVEVAHDGVLLVGERLEAYAKINQ